MDDAAIMERAGSARLASLYALHAPASVRFAYLLTGDVAVAEDLVQDAFVRLAGRLAHLRDDVAFSAYLRKTIVNLTRQRGRAGSRELRRLRVERDSTPAFVTQPDVETRDSIVTALAQLPERQRAALVCRYYLDLTESQTADALQCRVGTVKSLTARGLEALRGILPGRQL